MERGQGSTALNYRNVGDGMDLLSCYQHLIKMMGILDHSLSRLVPDPPLNIHTNIHTHGMLTCKAEAHHSSV